MKKILSFSGQFLMVISLFLFYSCTVQKENSGKIDRYSVVSRHNVQNNSFDTLSSLTVGNGEFAFTVDATGLQTFPELYSVGVPLGTMSEWGWHSFPNTENYKLEETYRYYKVEDREIPYAVQWNEPDRKKNASNYFRINPHRLHLGVFGFELLNSNNSRIKPRGGFKY